MVPTSVAAAPPSRNGDIIRLAELFHISFEYYATHESPLGDDFVRDVRTLVGLGFAACLADGSYIGCYQPYLTYFLNHDHGDFRKHSGALKPLSDAIAHMVLLAVSSFRILRDLNYPDYYQAFINVVKKTTNNIRTNMAGKNEQAREILKRLQCAKIGEAKNLESDD